MTTFRCSVLALATVFSVTAYAQSSHAQEQPVSVPAPAPSPTPSSPTTWYGWQTLAVDAAALGVMSVAVSQVGRPQSNIAPLFSVGAGVYAFGGPGVHLFHDKPAKAVGDLALRLGAPLVLGAVGYGIGAATIGSCPANDWCAIQPLVYGAMGAFAGYVSAVVIDAALLSRDKARPAQAATSGVRWSPQVGISPRGDASIGVGGSF